MKETLKEQIERGASPHARGNLSFYSHFLAADKAPHPSSATLKPMHSFVAVDVEVASRSPIRVCALGAVRIVGGCEVASLRSLVNCCGRVHYSDIHGLTASDLHGAPSWPVVWQQFRALLENQRTLVAYRAEFDRGALLTMCGRHGLRLPPVRFLCAAQLVERRFGRQLTLVEAMERLELPFAGRPHDPLADARAAAAIVLARTPASAATV